MTTTRLSSDAAAQQMDVHVENMVVAAVRERQPLADGLLLLAWRLQKDARASALWASLEEVCRTSMTPPVNRLHWAWFKEFLLASHVWYEPHFDAPQVWRWLRYARGISLLDCWWGGAGERRAPHV